MSTPFIILFQERSGSTHLYSLLNSHPEVTCRAEDFDFFYDSAGLQGEGEGSSGGRSVEPVTGRKLTGFQGPIENPSEAEVVAHLHEIFDGQPTTANGFKFKYPNQTAGYPEVVAYLERRRTELRVVHLDRENVIKRAVSKQVLVRMRRGGERSALRNANLVREVRYRSVQIDVEEAIRYAAAAERLRAGLVEHLAAFPHVHRLEYDDLVKQPDAVIPGLLEFLSVDPSVSLQTGVHKATPDALSDAIDNFDELAEALNGTDMARHLVQ